MTPSGKELFPHPAPYNPPYIFFRLTTTTGSNQIVTSELVHRNIGNRPTPMHAKFSLFPLLLVAFEGLQTTRLQKTTPTGHPGKEMGCIFSFGVIRRWKSITIGPVGDVIVLYEPGRGAADARQSYGGRRQGKKKKERSVY